MPRISENEDLMFPVELRPVYYTNRGGAGEDSKQQPPIPPRKIKAPRQEHLSTPPSWRNFKRWGIERRKNAYY